MSILVTSPGAAFDYAIAWPKRRTLGVAIAASDWLSEPAGLSHEPGATEGGRTRARFVAQAAGAYRITNRVTLADDRTLTRTLAIEVAR